MATFVIFLSCIVVGALAFSPDDQASSWFTRFVQRLFGKSEPKAAIAEPQTRTDNGWITILCDDPDRFGEWLDRDERSIPLGNNEEPSLGSHLLIELYDCDPKSLESEVSVGAAMRSAADVSKATVVAESFHEFKPWGVSGAVIIQESHYTIHTWPEHRYAAVDLFYCGGTILVHEAVEVLRARFRPGRMKFLVVRRGIESEVLRA